MNYLNSAIIWGFLGATLNDNLYLGTELSAF